MTLAQRPRGRGRGASPLTRPAVGRKALAGQAAHIPCRANGESQCVDQPSRSPRLIVSPKPKEPKNRFRFCRQVSDRARKWSEGEARNDQRLSILPLPGIPKANDAFFSGSRRHTARCRYRKLDSSVAVMRATDHGRGAAMSRPDFSIERLIITSLPSDSCMPAFL